MSDPLSDYEAHEFMEQISSALTLRERLVLLYLLQADHAELSTVSAFTGIPRWRAKLILNHLTDLHLVAPYIDAEAIQYTASDDGLTLLEHMEGASR